MTRLHDNGDALRLEDFHDGIGDFLGEAFLDLEAAGVHFGNARQLGKANDGVARDVANVHLQVLVLAPFFGAMHAGQENPCTEWYAGR